MRHWLRLIALLLFCGVIALSVPSQAAQRGKAANQTVQRVTTQQHQQQPQHSTNAVRMLWNAVKFQFGSWFGISTPTEPTIPRDDSGGPVKDSTDPRPRPWMGAILYDNGGEGIF